MTKQAMCLPLASGIAVMKFAFDYHVPMFLPSFSCILVIFLAFFLAHTFTGQNYGIRICSCRLECFNKSGYGPFVHSHISPIFVLFYCCPVNRTQEGSTKGFISEGRGRRHKTFLLRFCKKLKHFVHFKRTLPVTQAVYLCVPYRKICTAHGANHNAPFQLRPVQLYNKYNTLIVNESGLCLLYFKHVTDFTTCVH